jgi:galactokinase
MRFTKEGLSSKHIQLFNTQPPSVIVRSPGRVNIIGEHTDYNDGFVLPAAIDKAVYVTAAGNTDTTIRLYAAEFEQRFETELSVIATSNLQWPNYVFGVVDQLQKKGYAIGGFSMYIDGDIPIGAGMSSSAAVECAVLFALNELFALSLSRIEMALIAQNAEHEFAGVKCGIMDMFASLFGKKDHVMRLDCRDLSYNYVPLQIQGYKLVLLNTNVKHNLASSAYNTRRQQCEQGTQWVQEKYNHVKALRDVTTAMLQECVLPKDDLVYQRCLYVVEEISRLQAACIDLENGDVAALGKKMYATHEGLSKQYEVSCKELDILVDLVRNKEGVLGARMMGGGFGGCTINIIKEDNIAAIVETVAPAYKKATGLDLSYYITSAEEGTHLL